MMPASDIYVIFINETKYRIIITVNNVLAFLEPKVYFSQAVRQHFFLKLFLYICFFYKFIYLFIFSCVGSSFLCEGILQLRRAGATLHRGARASHYRGLSCCGARLQTRRLSSCGSWAQLLRGMWDLPRPGLEPMSPTLAGRLSSTAPAGKPQHF